MVHTASAKLQKGNINVFHMTCTLHTKALLQRNKCKNQCCFGVNNNAISGMKGTLFLTEHKRKRFLRSSSDFQGIFIYIFFFSSHFLRTVHELHALLLSCFYVLHFHCMDIWPFDVALKKTIIESE